MLTTLRRLLKSRRTKADEEFARYISISYEAYARACLSAENELSVEDNRSLAAACSEWLPTLTGNLHRKICQCLIEYHQSTADRDTSINRLIDALDRLPRFDRKLLEVEPCALPDSAAPPICEYCGVLPGTEVQFLSGEPTSVCSSMSCLSQHDELMCIESGEFREIGLIGGTYN